MSTVLIYTSPARGHLYPVVDVALALREVGHRVVVQTLADERERVVSAGLEHRAIAREIEVLRLDDYQGANAMRQVTRAFACWLARAPHEIDDLRATSREIRPDLLLVDANTWGAAAFAEATARPWAMFLPYVLPVPSPDTPAFGPGFAPPRNAFERLRDRVVWGMQNLVTRETMRRLDALRAGLGVPALRAHSDLFLRPDLLLYRTAEPFEYPRARWPENLRALGPGLWAPPGDVPDWIDELPHPRVLVSVSSEYQADGAIIEAALAALTDEPGSVVVTTSALDPDRFAAPHPRVRITRVLPHAAVMHEFDVVVTHGGMGTVQRALAAGVPACVVPWGRDQLETARRVELCGAGSTVPRARMTPDRMRAAVRLALDRKPSAERVAEAFRNAGGAPRAVQLIEQLLGGVGGRSRVA